MSDFANRLVLSFRLSDMGNDISLFDDAWVFLLEGSNSVSDYYIRNIKIVPENLRAWCELFEKRKRQCDKINVRYCHVSAPEKLGVYAENTDLEVLIDNSPASQIERALSSGFKQENWLNPLGYLRTQKNHHRVYSKTDSHWNFYGAFSVYQLLQAKLGLPVNNRILDCSRKENWSVMDLGAKFDPPLPEKVFFYRPSDSMIRTYSNAIVDFKERTNRTNDAGLHTGSYVVYENNAAVVDQSVMLFGDSFSEYRPHLLTGMLAETYKKVHFIWSSNIDWALVEKHKPDIVLTELAERFMPRVVPTDQFSIVNYEKKVMENWNREQAA